MFTHNWKPCPGSPVVTCRANAGCCSLHRNPEKCLDEYVDASGIATDNDEPWFRRVASKTGEPTRSAIWQHDACEMTRRRAADAGIKTRIGDPTF
jgi:hypothetical protein